MSVGERSDSERRDGVCVEGEDGEGEREEEEGLIGVPEEPGRGPRLGWGVGTADWRRLLGGEVGGKEQGGHRHRL